MIDFFQKSGSMTKRISGIAKLKGIPKVNPRDPKKVRKVGTFLDAKGPLASILLYVADDHDSKARGLMGVDNLPPFCGMLFEGLSGGGNFWMKDCLIPLDVAFLDKDGVVTKTYSMPVDKEGKDRYDYDDKDVSAVEVKMGMLDKWGVVKGVAFRSRPLEGKSGKDTGNG